MQIKQRLKKLERQTGVNDKFCRCGTNFYAVFVIGGENIVNNVCPHCERDVKPQTIAEFVIDAHQYEYELIRPKVDETLPEL